MKYMPLVGALIVGFMVCFLINIKAATEIVYSFIFVDLLCLVEYAIDSIKEHIDSKFKEQ